VDRWSYIHLAGMPIGHVLDRGTVDVADDGRVRMTFTKGLFIDADPA